MPVQVTIDFPDERSARRWISRQAEDEGQELKLQVDEDFYFGYTLEVEDFTLRFVEAPPVDDGDGEAPDSGPAPVTAPGGAQAPLEDDYRLTLDARVAEMGGSNVAQYTDEQLEAFLAGDRAAGAALEEAPSDIPAPWVNAFRLLDEQVAQLRAREAQHIQEWNMDLLKLERAQSRVTLLEAHVRQLQMVVRILSQEAGAQATRAERLVNAALQDTALPAEDGP